jgi:hypothetical protein
MMFTQLLIGLVLALHSGGTIAPRQGAPAQVVEGHARMMNVSGWEALKALADANVKGLSFVSLDSANDFVTFKGTEDAVLEVRLLLRKLDDVPKTLRRYHVQFLAPKTIYDRLIAGQPITGVSFISYDPTEGSLVARGTPAGLDKLAKAIAELDKK